MMTNLNDHAQATFQALHRSVSAPGEIFGNGATPFVSHQQENFIEEIRLFHLDTPSRIEKVQGLRNHIKLPSGCRDAQFFEQEKKETNWALCLRSSTAAS